MPQNAIPIPTVITMKKVTRHLLTEADRTPSPTKNKSGAGPPAPRPYQRPSQAPPYDDARITTCLTLRNSSGWTIWISTMSLET